MEARPRKLEKAQEDDVTGESPSAEKPEEAESADKEGEGSSSSNSTPQKKQVVCVATAIENTNADTEKLQKNRSCSWQQRPKTQIQTLKKRHHQRSPPKAMLPKGRSQRKLWGLMCQKGKLSLTRPSNQKLTRLDI